MTQNVPPSRDPSNDDSLIGFSKELIRFMLKNLDKALPVEVISHDRTVAPARVRVRPLIDKVDSVGEPVQRAEIASVPVLSLGAGGFMINYHIPAGQMGFIMTFDRDVSLFLQDQGRAVPNTQRMHTFEDSIFVPMQWFDYTINEEDTEAMVIQSLDNSIRIALDQDSIRVVNGETRGVFTDENITMNAPENIEFTANNISMTANNDITFAATNAFNTTANTAQVTATGGITLNGVTIDSSGALVSPTSVTAPMVEGTTDVTAGGVSGLSHTHGGVTPGSGNTGAPN